MKKTASELAVAIGATVDGDDSLEIQAVASPERAGAHDLIYVEAPKIRRARRSLGGSVRHRAARRKTPRQNRAAQLRAQTGLCKSRRAARRQAPIASGIHATAIIAPFAQIAANVAIGPYAVIGEDAHVGEGTQIGPHAVIGAGCWIGKNCRIHPRVTFYNGVRIGDRVEIHSGAVIWSRRLRLRFRRRPLLEISSSRHRGSRR